MNKQIATRQRIRKAILLITFLSFPITMNYFSPYVIIDGSTQGIVNGSLILFGFLFVSSLFLGRLWCGWVCPAGGLQEMIEPINNKAVKGKKVDWIKWLIWIPWITLIVMMVIRAGGYHSVNLLLDTQNGISVAGAVDRPIIFAYIIYYFVIALFIALPIFIGKRAACHTVCWMAPFMIIGRWIRNRFSWPSLRLTADSTACTNCKKCSSNCPMSLDVNAMVQSQKMENSECILCGTCVDNCAQKTIRYSFSKGK
jgi:ferredoxin-type protein NapH